MTVTDNIGAKDSDMIPVFIVAPLEIPEPVDLTGIESDIAAIKQDRAVIILQLEALTAALGGDGEDDGSDEDQAVTNKNDIEDVESKLTRVYDALGLGLILVLVLIIAIYYHSSASMINEIRENKDDILKTFDNQRIENNHDDENDTDDVEKDNSET